MWQRLEKDLDLNSLKNIVECLPNNKYDAIDQIRILFGISVEDFEFFLSILRKAKYANLEFQISDVKVEFTAFNHRELDDVPLEIKVTFTSKLSDGEVSIHYIFGSHKTER